MQMPEKKDYVCVSKGVHKQKFCNLQKSLNCKTPKSKYWFLKVLCLTIQLVCSGWLKNDSLCLRLLRLSKCFIISRFNGLGREIQRPDQEDHLQP